MTTFEEKASYQRWADGLVATEEGRRLYEEEAIAKETVERMDE